jgi:hypothetical protein
MKAEATRRPLLPACASALRMKWTRQRCQLALSTLRTAENFAPAIAIDADRDNHRDRHDAAVLAHLHVHRYGQSPSTGRARNAFTLSSISPHSGLTWLLEMPLIPIACTRSSTDRVETPCT